MKNITKLYAAYKAGCLGQSVLDTYFSFIANMMLEEKITVVEDTVVADKFKERYSIDLPLLFVRQVLGIGIQNGSIIENRGKYSIDSRKLERYSFVSTDFDYAWEQLVLQYKEFCRGHNVKVEEVDVTEFILKILDNSDDKILSGEKVDEEKGLSPLEYAWYSFVKETGEKEKELYSFIAAISASNITRQALFYFGNQTADYSNLHIYLDSPIIFALLGMDDESRTESYKKLVADMVQAKCSVHVLDHNFQEVDGIANRAGSWAISTHYDLIKANNAARYFHDNKMTEEEIAEFCGDIETKLNGLGITVRQTDYDVFQDRFQEDENLLMKMIKTRYHEQGREILPEKENSIQVDVRSIIMVYRERKGQTATNIHKAKHIMLTSNNTIANVSKNYESNRSLHSGHIPACVSVDLFGAILWLNTPLNLLEYQKKKLLADCYAFLKPDKKMLDAYIKSLDDARKAGDIEEKKFLFLRTHPVVLDSLMNITKGDYARFNSSTYLEVYEDIQSKSQKLYNDEAAAHSKTKMEKKKSDDENEALKKENERLKEKERNRVEKEKLQKIRLWGWVTTALFFGVPYIIIQTVIELLKSQFNLIEWGMFLYLAPLTLLGVAISLGYSKGKQLCFKLVKNRIDEKYEKEE